VLRDVLKANRKLRIIVIDPLTAYLGETQAHKNTQVRKVLTPLIKLVEDYGVLVIGVTHLNKSAGKAIYRVLDSIAFVALGRILHLVVQDSDNPHNRNFLGDKTNIGPKPAGLTFICQPDEVPTSRGNIWVSRVSWGTQTINQTADEAIAAATPRRGYLPAMTKPSRAAGNGTCPPKTIKTAQDDHAQCHEHLGRE
jgi:putative DNA primase/helicase